MKTFYGSSFMKKEELNEAGIYHPIKLEYYRTWVSKDDNSHEFFSKFGIEVVKTEYLENKVNIEAVEVKYITEEEKEINKILQLLKDNQVTPIIVDNVIEDLMKKESKEEIKP